MNKLKKSLAIFLYFIGLSAIAGGSVLMANGAGMPLSNLDGSVFSGYVWPGAVLVFVVGGTHLGAATLLLRGHRYEMESTAVAGFGLLIWIFTEVCIVGYHGWLQSVYFIFAVCTLIATMVLLKYGRKAIA